VRFLRELTDRGSRSKECAASSLRSVLPHNVRGRLLLVPKSSARDHSAILLTRVLSAGSWPRPLSSQASPPASIFQLVLCPATKVLAEILGFECAAATESLQLCSFRLFVFCSLYKLLIVLSCYRLPFLFFWIAYGLLL
jgi:hypothetical protein